MTDPMNHSLEQRLAHLALERARIEREQAVLKAEAERELTNLNDQIQILQNRRDQIISFLGLEVGEPAFARRGEIRDACIEVLRENPEGLFTREAIEFIEARGVRSTSVPATLSRLTEAGHVLRDGSGRYRLALPVVPDRTAASGQ